MGSRRCCCGGRTCIDVCTNNKASDSYLVTFTGWDEIILFSLSSCDHCLDLNDTFLFSYISDCLYGYSQDLFCRRDDGFGACEGEFDLAMQLNLTQDVLTDDYELRVSVDFDHESLPNCQVALSFIKNYGASKILCRNLDEVDVPFSSITGDIPTICDYVGAGTGTAVAVTCTVTSNNG